MFRFFGIFLILFIPLSCKENTLDFPIIRLQKQITIKNNLAEYTLRTLKDSANIQLVFSKSTQKQNTSSLLFYIHLDKAIKLKSINIKKNKFHKTPEKYKLYLNEIYTGTYISGTPIMIHKKVKSLKILFLNNTKLIHSWYKDRVLILNHYDFTESSTQILLNISSKDLIKFHVQRNRIIKPEIFKNKKFINEYFKTGSLNSQGKFYLKSGKEKTEFYVHFFDNNTFIIYELSRKNNNKSITHEIFYTGKWQCEKMNTNNVVLNLSGKLNGYFNEQKQRYIKNRTLEIKAEISDNKLYFNKLFQTLHLDFPEKALINIKEFIPGVQVKLAYASTNNFTKTKLYPCNKCFIRYKAAKALRDIQKELEAKGMSLIFYDCYRPYHIQKIMFEKFPVKGYVAPPIGGSIHNRGLAVDLSILDKNGKELNMGTGFDELSIKSNHSYTAFADTILNNRLYLKNLMIKHGFSPIRSEWWHYNFLPKHQFPVINDNFLCD